MKNIKNKSLLKKFLFIGIIIYVVYTFFSQQKMLNAYKEDQERYSEQIAEAEELQEELKTTKENKKTKDNDEEIARQKQDKNLQNERE